uniref:Uncharacterized protein n=1 Tax=Anguilla anguilla TaxID=7936 RepID=A0A0E9RQW9_ANGAN
MLNLCTKMVRTKKDYLSEGVVDNRLSDFSQSVCVSWPWLSKSLEGVQHFLI